MDLGSVVGPKPAFLHLDDSFGLITSLCYERSGYATRSWMQQSPQSGVVFGWTLTAGGFRVCIAASTQVGAVDDGS